MKGIAHFLTGIALSTFFPDVVRQAAGGALLPVLGGIAGILPDTLDFKFLRFFEKHDFVVDPGPNPDAGQIAAGVAEAMRQAYEARSPRTVVLHTIRTDADLWRRYVVHFQPASGEVMVRIGPLVSTAQLALPGSAAVPPYEEARVSAGVRISAACATVITVDAFTGPTITFEREGDRLDVRVLDWHRRWTHSLTFAAALGVAAGGIALLGETLVGGGPTRMSLLAGLVVGLGVLGHIVEDQMGAMGSNLLYPLTRRRTRGLGWMHSGDAIPNSLTVLVSSAAILLNLDRFASQPRLDPVWFAGAFIVLPALVLGALYARQRARAAADAMRCQRPEILSEMADGESSQGT